MVHFNKEKNPISVETLQSIADLAHAEGDLKGRLRHTSDNKFYLVEPLSSYHKSIRWIVWIHRKLWAPSFQTEVNLAQKLAWAARETVVQSVGQHNINRGISRISDSTHPVNEAAGLVFPALKPVEPPPSPTSSQSIAPSEADEPPAEETPLPEAAPPPPPSPPPRPTPIQVPEEFKTRLGFNNDLSIAIDPDFRTHFGPFLDNGAQDADLKRCASEWIIALVEEHPMAQSQMKEYRALDAALFPSVNYHVGPQPLDDTFFPNLDKMVALLKRAGS